MNLLVPGSGVILLGQPWLGMALAVWFALIAELAICGFLIAPASVPIPGTVIGAILAGASWLLAQGLLAARIRFLGNPNLPAELTILRQLVEEALARNDYKAAKAALLIALSIDDSDLPTQVLWARMVTATGTRSRARRAWRRVARLDRQHQYTQEANDVLDHLEKSESAHSSRT